MTSTTTFTYEITTINQCNPGTNEISYSGMITVLPSETISQTLTSGPTVQTVCVNTSIQPITFDVTGQDTRAKFVDASLVPSGITLDFQPNADLNGGLATILGAPDNTNAAGDYTFEITTGVSGAVSNTSICADQTQEILEQITPKKWLKTAHHLLILHGRYTCKSQKPMCDQCVITKHCLYLKNEKN